MALISLCHSSPWHLGRLGDCFGAVFLLLGALWLAAFRYLENTSPKIRRMTLGQELRHQLLDEEDREREPTQATFLMRFAIGSAVAAALLDCAILVLAYAQGNRDCTSTITFPASLAVEVCAWICVFCSTWSHSEISAYMLVGLSGWGCCTLITSGASTLFYGTESTLAILLLGRFIFDGAFAFCLCFELFNRPEDVCSEAFGNHKGTRDWFAYSQSSPAPSVAPNIVSVENVRVMHLDKLLVTKHHFVDSTSRQSFRWSDVSESERRIASEENSPRTYTLPSTDMTRQVSDETNSLRARLLQSRALSVGGRSVPHMTLTGANVVLRVVDWVSIFIHGKAAILYTIAASWRNDLSTTVRVAEVSTARDVTAQHRNDELVYLREMLETEFPRVSLPPVPCVDDSALNLMDTQSSFRLEQHSSYTGSDTGRISWLGNSPPTQLAAKHEAHRLAMTEFLNCLIADPAVGAVALQRLLASPDMSLRIDSDSLLRDRDSTPLSRSSTESACIPDNFPLLINCEKTFTADVVGWRDVPVEKPTSGSSVSMLETEVVYEIEVAGLHNRWSIRKRYSQFRVLHGALHSRGHAVPPVPPTSPRMFERKLEERNLNETTLALDSFMRHLLALQPLPLLLVAFLESDVWRRRTYVDVLRRPDGSVMFEECNGDDDTARRLRVRNHWHGDPIQSQIPLNLLFAKAPLTNEIELGGSLSVVEALLERLLAILRLLSPVMMMKDDFLNADEMTMLDASYVLCTSSSVCTPRGTSINCWRIRQVALPSSAFLELSADLSVLSSVNLRGALQHSEKLSLNLNLYNLLSLHSSILLVWPPPADHATRAQIISRAQYQVGESRLSLLELEMCLLRAPSFRPRLPLFCGSPCPPLLDWRDVRTSLVLDHPEPFVSFCLALPTRGSPHVTVFRPSNVKSRLSEAATAYIARHLCFDMGKLYLPKVLARFIEDFSRRESDDTPSFVATTTRIEDAAEGKSSVAIPRARKTVGDMLGLRRSLPSIASDDESPRFSVASGEATDWDFAIKARKQTTDAGVRPTEAEPQGINAALFEQFHTLGDLMISEEWLRQLWKKLFEGVECRERMIRLRMYKHCFIGSEALQFLVRSGEADTVEHAIILCNALIDAGRIRHVTGEHWMENKDLYYAFVTDMPATSVQECLRASVIPRLTSREVSSSLLAALERDDQINWLPYDWRFAFPFA